MNEGTKEQSNYFDKIKKLSQVKKAILTFILLIFLGVCFWLYIIVDTARYYDANKQIVDDFFTFTSHEDYKQAYTLYADKYKKEENFETFKNNILPGKETLSNYKPNSFQITKSTRFIYPIYPAILRYIGEIAYQNGEKTEIIALFIWEHNNWKLYQVEIDTSTNMQRENPSDEIIYNNAT